MTRQAEALTASGDAALHAAGAAVPAVAAVAPDEAADARCAGGLDVQHVTITYRNGHTALRDASFCTPLGSITALVGVNGSGKSTLFKSIMGLLRLSEGQVRVLGMPAREAMRRNLVAYVPQSEEVDWNFPVLVEDVVMMGRYGHMGFLRIPGRADHAAVEQALQRVGLLELRQRQIGELSGGQKKRVFLARALAQDARVILLDEPFTGVDVKTEDAIIALLRALRDEGRVMLVSTHNLGSVPEFCDRTVLVRNTVLAYGPTAEIFTHANLERAFGGVLRHFDLPQHHGAGSAVVGIMSDDERPLVLLDGRSSVRGERDAPAAGQAPAAGGEGAP
ncbi:manganese/iron ABC transporter ATP-binding protein [Corticibacter populi]|uniref:Manganese/iron ABC transporter ATP-binding protein n=1 Tax=Corticibacter populi TaxID=1550736 RepID=A0A3M6QJD6_9BURK|nr:manganese/iron ABC transporter ATP-binding protein [Corticibacter populi]RMX02602.1 manganese/iron ABC transporter ATP-binding protein [Corticibacter populi]RZS32984.1 manganese/iron transport system ATP-binding protein [Corticibacter populi]